MNAIRRGGIYTGVIAFVFVVWLALTTTGLVKPLLLSSPAKVVQALGALLATPAKVFEPLIVTLAETATAFLIAAVAGAVIGIVVGSSKLLAAAYEPLITTVSALPLIILYPVLAATLGVGGPSKIAIGAVYGFFPIAISTMRAVARVDSGLLMAAKTMGGRGFSIARLVVVPAISPAIIAAMRVSLALSLVTIIAAEFISGAAGVGYQLAAASQGLNTPTLFAWVIISILLTVLVNVLFAMITTFVRKGIEQ